MVDKAASMLAQRAPTGTPSASSSGQTVETLRASTHVVIASNKKLHLKNWTTCNTYGGTTFRIASLNLPEAAAIGQGMNCHTIQGTSQAFPVPQNDAGGSVKIISTNAWLTTPALRSTC